MISAWDWREVLLSLVSGVLFVVVLRVLCSYHGGRGSLWLRLAISEPSERVNCTRRWRDCSRTLIWSGVGVAILDMMGKEKMAVVVIGSRVVGSCEDKIEALVETSSRNYEL